MEKYHELLTQLTFPDYPELKVSATLGGATWNFHKAFSELSARADKTLYEGKTAGRNRVIISY